MATSIECSACGHTVPADHPFCGMCGTAVDADSSKDSMGSQPNPFRDLLGHVRVPWSLGLLGFLVMGSLLLGGDDRPVEAFPDTVAAPSPVDVETVPEAAVIEVVPEAIESAPEAADPDDLGSKQAAAARLDLIEAERAAEEQRQLELARQAEADLLQRLQEQAEAEYEAAQAAAARDAEPEGAQPTPPPASEPGSLRLIVLPFGDIYVNGALQARDMSRFELSLPPGTYDLRLENATRQPVDTTVVIRAGESTPMRVTLRPRNR